MTCDIAIATLNLSKIKLISLVILSMYISFLIAVKLLMEASKLLESKYAANLHSAYFINGLLKLYMH
jgi:hypothetical protein